MLTRWSACLVLVSLAASARGDTFDNYFNPHLAKIPTSEGVQKIAKLTPEIMVGASRVLPGVSGTFVVVKTNEGRWSKLLVHPGKQKVPDAEAVPIVLVDRFVTFKEGEEKTVFAQGKKMNLFADFRLSLDIGQIVPAPLGGDLKFVVEGDQAWLEPVGKAEMYLATKHLVETTPKKYEKVVVGEKIEPRHFAGVYKLNEDGRRMGELHLAVKENGDVYGHLYSDKDGQKYEVEGKVGTPPHTIQFRVTLPRTIQFYTGCMFTADGAAIAGFAKMQERETGFYAIRKE